MIITLTRSRSLHSSPSPSFISFHSKPTKLTAASFASGDQAEHFARAMMIAGVYQLCRSESPVLQQLICLNICSCYQLLHPMIHHGSAFLLACCLITGIFIYLFLNPQLRKDNQAKGKQMVQQFSVYRPDALLLLLWASFFLFSIPLFRVK